MAIFFILHRHTPTQRSEPRLLRIESALAFISILTCVSGYTSPLTQSKTKICSEDSELVAVYRAQAADYQTPQNQGDALNASFESARGTPLGDSSKELQSTRLTVEQALLYTLDNHPRLRARREEVEVARSELITASLLPNAKELQLFDIAAINDALRQLGEIKSMHLKLRYQHNLLRAHLELLLGRRLNDIARPRAG